MALGIACGGKPGVYPKASVVLLSIDTLRSDHLPPYGYNGVETPAISALAREAILFEHAWSQVPLTLPSHSTILSGLLPGEHGVRDNLGYRFKAEVHPDLPVLLKGAGYKTGAAVSAYVLRGETGLAAGFDFYESGIDLKANETLGKAQRSCRETLAAANGWLETNAKEPFFLFLHFYEPHTPYEPDPKFRGRFASPYDGEIATVDECVAALVANLRRLGAWDGSLFVLLSDHGEGLGDHGEPEHGILLYREALEVPLLVKLPGGARGGTRVGANAALVDVAPTILSTIGLAVPVGMKGAPLLSSSPADSARPIYSETYYPRLHMGWHELASIVQERSHLIDGPDPELYDLEKDRGERENLRDRERRSFAALRAAAAGFAVPLVAPAAEDAETASKLASLGYLSAAKIGSSDSLPDPKSRIGSLEEYGRAIHALTSQDYGRAATLFGKLAEENPAMVDAWENLGVSSSRLGRRDDAVRALTKAMELSGGADHVALAMGDALLDLGKLDEAARHAALALPTSPAGAHSLLARIAAQRKDFPVAETEARAALEARGSRIGPRVILARILCDEGKLDEALAETDRAVAELAKSGTDSTFNGLYFVRGDVLARLERPGEAEEAFLREIRTSPGIPDSYTRLAALYASLGKNDAAVSVLQALLQKNPDAPIAWAEAAKTFRVLGDPGSAERLLAEARRRFPRDPVILDAAKAR